jgi:hypothetical protein
LWRQSVRRCHAAGGVPARQADLPVGTTAYVWTHQGDELEEQTLRTLAESPFNKPRMCVFPKAFLYNTNEPHLERRIGEPARLGIEADLILFHPYVRLRAVD